MGESDCIFCQIVDGEIPSHTIYEDDAVMAFLDANPLTEGHTLIIPKDHYSTMDEMPDAVGAAIGRALTQLAPVVENSVGANASTIGINNGEDAGQEIPHVHAHVIPRTPDDHGGSIHSIFSSTPEIGDDELAELAQDIETRI